MNQVIDLCDSVKEERNNIDLSNIKKADVVESGCDGFGKRLPIKDTFLLKIYTNGSSNK